MRFKRILIVAFSLCFIAVLVFAFLNWRAANAVKSRLSVLREAGKPTSISDLRPAKIPPGMNAFEVIAGLTDALSQYERELGDAIAPTATPEAQEAAAIEISRKMALEFPTLVVSLHDAAKLPEYEALSDYSLAPNPFMEKLLGLQPSPRTVVRVLHSHGLMSLADNNTTAAIQDAIAIFNLSEHIGKEPLMVNALVSGALFGMGVDLASRCLYTNGAEPEARSQLLDAITPDESLVSNFMHALDTERAFAIDSFQSFPLAHFMPVQGMLTEYLDSMSAFLSVVEERSGIAPKTPMGTEATVGLTGPAFAHSLKILRRSQAKSRAVRILAAWQDQGSDPNATLDALGLPDSVSTDPFDGSKMKLKAVNGSVMVFAVGDDLTDDDGDITDDRDVGIAPKGHRD